MATRLPFHPDSAAVDRDFSLLVTWRETRSDPGVGQLNVGGDVAAHLRDATAETRRQIRERRPREYSPEMHLEDEESIVLEGGEVVRASPIARYFSATHVPLLSAHNLPTPSLTSYGVVVGVGEERRAYVRKTNPKRSARAGGMFTVLGDALTTIQEPVFALDAYFDLLVSPEAVIALDQKAFEDLFRMLPEEGISVWVRQIADVLPLAGDGARQLEERARKNSLLRRKLRTIVDRGHLERVSASDIRAHLKELRFAPEDFIDRHGRLVFNNAKPRDLLDLLNEDLFRGGLTRERFRIDRKSVDPDQKGSPA